MAPASQALTSGSQPTGKRTTIETYSAWDGSSEVIAFGCPNTTTYGQVITIPKRVRTLTRFTFPWMNLSTGSMVVRGEVYAWDGTKATGKALYESSPMTIDFSDGAFHNVTFKGASAKVKPGSQYVVFASIDKDFESCTGDYTTGWGSVPDTTYAGGDFVYQNNTGDESQWTTTAWDTFGLDLAFKICLK